MGLGGNPQMRDMVFVSHANPEDNEFARWVALQLAREGYPVWCDLTKLIGGETFWEDIQSAIRERTVKFLYVLSRASNTKPGTLDELEIARGIQRQASFRDFIIPLWIDDLPSQDFYSGLVRINAIRFQEGWATGLARLLEKLEQDAVPKRPDFNPEAVTHWWREHMSATVGMQRAPEQLVSNWYPLAPTALYFHELTREGPGSLAVSAPLPYPCVQHNQYLVSFAPATDLQGHLGPDISITTTHERRLNDPEAATAPRIWTFAEERGKLYQLLREAWEGLIRARGLATHAFANNASAFFFTKGQVPSDTVSYAWSMGLHSSRRVVGYRTVNERLRYWHFALQAKPRIQHPWVGYVMKPHVLFSDDGEHLWESADRLHRARRSQCRGWWNDKWRDLIAGTVSWLAQGDATITLPVGTEATLHVGATPLWFTSPVSMDDGMLSDEPDGQSASEGEDALESGEWDEVEDEEDGWDEVELGAGVP
jgi:hypothetical protein